MKIGELARAAQTQVETVRYYEREGLLPPAPRSGANYRVYAPGHLERLAFIRHCRALDMTLAEVRALLAARDDPAGACGSVNVLLDEHIAHVAERIRELGQLQQQLRRLREQCAGNGDTAHCGILDKMARSAAAPARQATDARPAHVPGAHARRPRRS
jgi:Cd(II)/Pb(II)-responsive transcriptional regulator